MTSRLGRAFFAATSAAVATGIVVQMISLAGKNADTSAFPTTLGRLVNLFFYFTIESNLICGVTCLLLAVNPDREHRVFGVFRLAGVAGVTITGIVYHVALRSLYELQGLDKFADIVLHTIVPIAGLLGWAVFGPRGLAPRKVALLTVLYPLTYFAVTLIRGPIVDWYPYPFIDVIEHGYAQVALNATVVAALVLAVCSALSFIDAKLPEH